MDKLQVVKIGGNVIDNSGQLQGFLEKFHAYPGRKILVHGGGKRATLLSRQIGIEPQLVDGRRITKAADLEVAIMVYAGLINKQIVASLQSYGTNALGMSGADANAVRASKRPAGAIDFGFVGDVQSVNREALKGLLEAGFIPVLCALTHDGKGQLLNTNADTIAAEVASAMATDYETELVYCFEKDGVLQDVNDPSSIIPDINRVKYDVLHAQGVFHDGMLPKLANCFLALDRKVSRVIITNAINYNDASKPHTTITL